MSFDVLTKEEAARKARISARYMHALIKDGQGPALTTIGRRVLIRTDALQDWLISRTAEPQHRVAA